MEMFDITEENDFNTAKQLLSMMEKHYSEVEDKSETIPLQVNWGLLKSFFDAGLVSLVVARSGGKLVGYFANLITEDFMTSTLAAREMALYIDPAHRHGKLFFKIMKKATEVLKSRGVKTQFITFKSGHNESLPLRCGFTHTETTYQKILGE